MEFLDSALFKLLFSSVVIVAFITSLFNYFISRKTNSRLLEIESFKRLSELDTYRYTNIFAAMKEINSLPKVNYNFLKEDKNGNMVKDDKLFGKVIVEAGDRFSKVKNSYELISALMERDLTTKVDALMNTGQGQYDLLIEHQYTNTPLPEGVDIVKLVQTQKLVENEIIKAMKQQINKLTASAIRNS